ncbi:hypothetical protein V3C99_001096 [Haemonchus contortus]
MITIENSAKIPSKAVSAKRQVPTRFELALLDSKSRVLTATLRNQRQLLDKTNSCAASPGDHYRKLCQNSIESRHCKTSGSGEIRTRVTGFKVQGVNRYTTEPTTTLG